MKDKIKIYSINDPEFRPYGKVLTGYDASDLMNVMELIRLPDSGTEYSLSIDVLEGLPIFEEIQDRAYGGMPAELGMCWGRNTKLNCLEYHQGSEINIGSQDFILLLARIEEIVDGELDTSCVKAFRVPAGEAVELYATTLHYAPCHTDHETGFHVAVALPRGTNEDIEPADSMNIEDKLLWKKNKWLIAHPESYEAERGAYVGLTGKNIDIEGALL